MTQILYKKSKTALKSDKYLKNIDVAQKYSNFNLKKI